MKPFEILLAAICVICIISFFVPMFSGFFYRNYGKEKLVTLILLNVFLLSTIILVYSVFMIAEFDLNKSFELIIKAAMTALVIYISRGMVLRIIKYVSDAKHDVTEAYAMLRKFHYGIDNEDFKTYNLEISINGKLERIDVSRDMFFGLASALGIELGDFREGYSHELEKEVPLKTKYYTKSRIFTEVEIDKRKMQEK